MRSKDEPTRREDEAAGESARRAETSASLRAIAHEFNDLLTVILGFADLVLKTMRAEDLNRSFLCEIQMAGERAKHLTQRLVQVDRTSPHPDASDPATCDEDVSETRIGIRPETA